MFVWYAPIVGMMRLTQLEDGASAGDDARMTPCALTIEAERWCCGVDDSDFCFVWPDHPQAVTIRVDF
jgi:hypothetical protein